MNRRYRQIFSVLALTSLTLPAWSQTPSPQRSYYKVVSATAYQLTTLGGVESVANDVNNLGHIVGWSADNAGTKRAFLLKASGSIQNVGTTVVGEDASAEGINDNTEIVGQFLRGTHRPFYWHSSSGIVKMSIDLFPNEDFEPYNLWAFAINDDGYVVGRGVNYDALPFCRQNAPVVWTNPYADPKILRCSGEWWLMTAATDVSNSGWIAHFNEVANNDRAFRHSTYYGVSFPVPDVAADVTSLHLWGVNEAGVVVGDSERDSFSNVEFGKVGYYWNGTSTFPKTIEPFAGGDKAAAFDVNEQDFVVGYGEKGMTYFGDPYVGERAFLWHEEFGRYELPTPAAWQGIVTYCRANALNDLVTSANGDKTLRIVGYCQKKYGVKQAVRWTAVIGKTSTPPVSGAN
jgi:probable HAF family extracellular repeat protein